MCVLQSQSRISRQKRTLSLPKQGEIRIEQSQAVLYGLQYKPAVFLTLHSEETSTPTPLTTPLYHPPTEDELKELQRFFAADANTSKARFFNGGQARQAVRLSLSMTVFVCAFLLFLRKRR